MNTLVSSIISNTFLPQFLIRSRGKKMFVLFFFLSIFLQSCIKERIELAWTEIEVPTSIPLEDVQFFTKDTGVVVGGLRYQQGVSFRTYDGGNSWQIDTLSQFTLYDINIIDANSHYIIGHYGHLFKFSNDGNLLNHRVLPYMEFYWTVNVYDPQTMVTSSGGAYINGGLYLSNVNQEARDTFIDDFPHEMNEAVFLDIKTLIAVGFGAIYRSTDGGLSWTRIEVNGDNFKAVHFPSPQVGYVVGASGKILKTTDGGLTWDEQNAANNLTASRVEFNDVHFLSDDVGYAVGNFGTFWKTENGGTDWQIVDNFPNVNFLAISFLDNQGYLVTREGRMFTFL